MNAILARNILSSITTPYPHLEQNLRPRKIIAINLRSETMIPPGAKVWDDLANTGSAGGVRTLFYYLARATQCTGLGSDTGYYFNGNTPKLVPVVERLLNPQMFPTGYRIWIFQIDEAYDLREAMKKVLDQNIAFAEEEKKKATSKRFNLRGYQCYKQIKSMAEYTGMIDIYTHAITNGRVSPDDLASPEYAITHAESPLNPYVCFDPRYAIGDPEFIDEDESEYRLCVDGICVEQTNLSNYFDVLDNGATPTFKGFPFPEQTFKYDTVFFSPQNLASAPLPNILRDEFLGRVIRLDAEMVKEEDKFHAIVQKKDDIMNLYCEGPNEDARAEKEAEFNAILAKVEQTETATTVMEKELLDIHYDLEVTRERMRNLVGEIKSAPDENISGLYQYLRPQSGLGRMLLSTTSLMEDFATKNHFIALRIENEKVLTNLDNKYKTSMSAIKSLQRKYFADYYSYRQQRMELKKATVTVDKSAGPSYEIQLVRYKRIKDTLINRMCNNPQEYRTKMVEVKFTYDPKKHPENMYATRKSMVATSWNVMMNSHKVTGAVENARMFFRGLPKEKHFVQNPQTYKNLGIFANMVVRFVMDLNDMMDVETQFQFGFLIYLNLMATYRFSHGPDAKNTIRPNVCGTGPAGAGKSYVMESVKGFSMPGTTSSATHITQQAFAVDDDISDFHIMCDETPLYMLGISKEGREVPVDPQIKARMSQQQTVTLSFEKTETGRRETKVSLSRSAMNGTYLSNLPNTDDPNGPLNQRCLPYKFYSRKRDTYMKGMSAIVGKQFASKKSLCEKKAHGWSMIHFYLLFWEQCITSLALPEIDTSIADFVESVVFKYLCENGVAAPHSRHISMYRELCRVATMLGALESEFFSEMGLRHRIDLNTGVTKGFEPEAMLDLIKWSVVTEETAVAVITTMENTWIPYNRSIIAKIMANNLNVWPPSEETARSEGTKFMKTEAADFRGAVDKYDLRYITLEGATYREIHNKIVSCMKDKMSVADVVSVLSDMTTDMMDCYPKEFYNKEQYERQAAEYELSQMEDEQISLMADIIGKYPQLATLQHKFVKADIAFDEEEDGLIQEGQELEKEVWDLVQKALKNREKMVEIMADIKKKKETEANALDNRVNLLRAKRGLGPKQITQQATLTAEDLNDRMNAEKLLKKVLMNRIGSKPEKLPCVKIDFDPRDRNKKRISILVDLVDRNYKDILKKALQNLQHEYHPKATYITGLTYERCDKKTEVKEPIYWLFDTVEMNPNPGKTIGVGNKYYVSGQRRLIFQEIYGEEIDDIEASPGIVLDKDYEEIVFKEYWKNSHIPQDVFTYLAYPSVAKETAWDMQTKRIEFAPARKCTVEHYPDDVIAKLDDDRAILDCISTEEGRQQCIKEGKYVMSRFISKSDSAKYESVKYLKDSKMMDLNKASNTALIQGLLGKGKRNREDPVNVLMENIDSMELALNSSNKRNRNEQHRPSAFEMAGALY